MTHEKLNYMDCAALLKQLKRGGFKDQLTQPEGSKFIHFDALHSYLLSRDDRRRAVWAECLHLLIDAQAPANLAGNNVIDLLCFHGWGPNPEVTAELARAYMGAWYFSFSSPIHGALPSSADKANKSAGQMPLANAIIWDNHHLVRLACDMDVSWNVGALYAGGPQREAFELATDARATKSLAVLTESMMCKRIAAGVGMAPAADPMSPANPTPRVRRASL